MNDDETNEQAEQILIDDSADFNFYAAHIAYTKAWTDNLDETIRLELNNLMNSLKENEVSYPAFYRKIDQYRNTEEQVKKPWFKAKKKRAWRKSEAKKTRIGRHKN
ncbi:MAG: hypothetical protein V3R57_07890 [Candidatus Bathyarchaeia archaeon]